MKKYYSTPLFYTFLFILGLQYSIAQTTWTGTLSSDWNETSNWSAGVPTNTSNVIIPNADFARNYPVLTNDVTIQSLTFDNSFNGTSTVGANIDLNGFILTVNQDLTVANHTTITVTRNFFSSQPNAKLIVLGGKIALDGLSSKINFYVDCDFTISATGTSMRGNTFYNRFKLFKTNSSNDDNGGNIFKDIADIRHEGGGNLQFGHTVGGADTFEKDLNVVSLRGKVIMSANTTGNSFQKMNIQANKWGAFFIREGIVADSATFETFQIKDEQGIRVAHDLGNIVVFKKVVTVRNIDSDRDALFRCSFQGTTVFEDNIIVESNGGTLATLRYIDFGNTPNNALGKVILAAGKTITIGNAGFSVGELRLGKIYQSNTISNHTHQLNLTGTAKLLMERDTLAGNITASCSNEFRVRRCVLGNDANDTIRLTVLSDNLNLVTRNGGNIFKGTAYLANEGRSEWYWGFDTNGGKDIFQADAYIIGNDMLTPDPPATRLTNYKANYQTNLATNYTTNYATTVNYILPPYYIAESGTWTGTKVGFVTYPRLDNLPTNTGDPDLDAANATANENAAVINQNNETQSETNIANATEIANASLTRLNTAINNLNTAINTANTVLLDISTSPAYMNNEGNAVALYNQLQTAFNTANTYLPTAQTSQTNVNNAINDLANPPGDDQTKANEAHVAANQSHTLSNDIYAKINALHTEINNLNTVYNAALTPVLDNTEDTGILAVAYNTQGNLFQGKTFIQAEDRARVWVLYANSASTASFEKKVTITNNSTTDVAIRMVYGDGSTTPIATFKDTVIINQNEKGTIDIARNGQAIFEKDIQINSTQIVSGITLLGTNAQIGSILMQGNLIPNLTRGRLELNNFTKQNTNPFTIQTNTAAEVRINGNSVFNGEATLINNATSGVFYISNATSSANVVFNGKVNLINQNTQRMDISALGLTTFNGDIFIENRFAYTDVNTIAVHFGRTTGQTILNNGFKISVGTFEKGRLYLGNFQQKGTAQNQIIQLIAPLANTQAEISTDKNTSFEANTIIEANQVRLNLTTFFDEATIRCYQQGENSGGNTFKKKATLEFKGTNTNWILGNTLADTFEDEIEFYNNGINSNMYIAHNSLNNTFLKKVTIRNGGDANCDFYVTDQTGGDATFKANVDIINTATTGNIYFSRIGNTNFEGNVLVKNTNGNLFFGGSSNVKNDVGIVTIKSTASFALDAATPWQTGELHLKNFIYEPTTALNLNLHNGNDNNALYLALGSRFEGNVTATAGSIFLDGATFNKNATIEKKGALGNDQSKGGNIFNGITRITNNSIANQEMYLATQKGDDFNGDVTFVVPNTNSGYIIPAYKDKTTFSGNITITGNSDKAFDFGGTGRTPTLGKGTGIVIFDGTGTQSLSNQLTTSIEINFRELQIKQATATSVLSFDRSFTVTHYAKFNLGKIRIGNNTMTIANSSNGNSIAIFNPNRSHVIADGLGTVNREVPNTNTNVIFPVGNELTYTPATLSQINAGTTDIFRIRILNDVYLNYQNQANNYVPIGGSINAHFARRTWIINENTTGGSNANLILQWNANAPSDELPQFDRSNVSIVRFNNTTSTWSCTQQRGASQGPPNTRRATNNLNSFGIFSIATIKAIAGPDQIICSPNDLTLAATSLDAPFSGEWTQTSGPTATINEPNSPTSTVSGILPSSEYTFRWTNKSLEGDCGAGLYDEVTIQVGNEGFSPTVNLVTWTGNFDSNWFNCANWTDFTIPNETVDVIIPNTSLLPHLPIIQTSGSRAKSLTIQNGGKLRIDINGNLIVEQNAELQIGSKLINLNSFQVKGDLIIRDSLENHKQIEVFGDLVNYGKLFASSTESLIELHQNFENHATLVHTQGTVRFFDNSNVQILGSISPNFFDVNVDKSIGNQITLNLPVSIKGTITFLTGLLKTSATNLLIIEGNAEASSGNANSYVNGPMRKIGNDAFVFPVGKGNRWARIAISSLQNSNSNDYFTAEYFPNGFGDYTVIGELSHVSRLEYWNLDRGNLLSGNGTTGVKVTLYWEDANRSQIDNLGALELVVAHFNSAEWENKGSVEAFVSGGLQGNVTSSFTLTDFSPFTFGSRNGIGNPLPAVLVNFTATKTYNQQSKITWTTSTEQNVSHFEIEKSNDGVNFETIKTQDAFGNSSVIRNYQILDENPLAINYYRLKTVDLNGNTYFSKIVSLNFESNAVQFNIYPNPFIEQINISFELADESNYQMRILDANGRIVLQKTSKGNIGTNIETLELQNLSQGNYLIEWTNGNQKEIKRIVKNN